MTSGPLKDMAVRIIPMIATTNQMKTRTNPKMKVHARFSTHFLAKQVTPQIPAKTDSAANPINTPKDEVANYFT